MSSIADRWNAIEKRIEELEEENERLREKLEDRERTPQRQNAVEAVTEHYPISEESAHRLSTSNLTGLAAEAYRENGRPVPPDVASAAQDTDNLEEEVPSGDIFD